MRRSIVAILLLWWGAIIAILLRRRSRLSVIAVLLLSISLLWRWSAVALLRGVLLLRRWAAIAILLGRRALIVILLSWIVRHGWRLVGMRVCLVTVYGAVELVLGAYTQ